MGADLRNRSRWLALILILVFLFAPFSLIAGITFERAYPRPGEDWGSCVQQTSDGGYILLGINDAIEVLLVKTDSLGEVAWERTYGAGYGRTVLQLPDGGYAVAGDSGLGSFTCDAYIFIADSLGNQLIKKTYGDSLVDEIRSVLGPTSDGGFMLTSSTDGDMYLVKLDSLGDSLWSRICPTPDTNDYPESVQQTNDGGYIIGCDRMDPERQAYVVKTDSLGNLSWTKVYGFAGSDDYCFSAIQTADSGYALAATSRHQLGGGWLIKTDAFGDSLWSRTDDSLEEAFSLLQNPDGGYVISGWGGAQGGAHIVRTDSLGVVLWERTYASDISWGRSVQRTSDGGYVMFGHYCDPVTYEHDWYLVKMDSGGMVDRDVEVVSLDLPPDTVFTDSVYEVRASVRSLLSGFAFFDLIATVDGYSDTVRVNGLKQDSLVQVTFNDWQVPSADSTTYTMTLCTVTPGDIDTTNDCMQKTIFAYDPTGVQEGYTRPSASEFRLRENTPDPFHHSTVISYSLPQTSEVTLSIYDITGRLVGTLVNERQQPGIHQVRWERKDNPSGVYFYRLKAGESVEARKMVVVE
jgi:hypothetical protein